MNLEPLTVNCLGKNIIRAFRYPITWNDRHSLCNRFTPWAHQLEANANSCSKPQKALVVSAYGRSGNRLHEKSTGMKPWTMYFYIYIYNMYTCLLPELFSAHSEDLKKQGLSPMRQASHTALRHAPCSGQRSLCVLLAISWPQHLEAQRSMAEPQANTSL